jgi:ATP phosphoribosyltransferase
MTADRLIIAVPSKGRLEERAHRFFEASGLPIKRGESARIYAGRLPGVPGAEILYVATGEIPDLLDSGVAHLGITGEDLLRERLATVDRSVVILKRLGFGFADLVVAVPRSWIDVRSMADLDDVAVEFHRSRGRRLRIATKYLSLTRAFFAEHGIIDYRIVESMGATEGAPISGAAEAIVDITSTGATLSANNLKVLEDGLILKSEATLSASLRAPWGPGARRALRHVLDMIAAHDRAEAMRVIRVALDGRDLRILAVELAGAHGCVPLSNGVGGPANGDLALQCPSANLYAVVEKLRAVGCARIVVDQADYIFEAENPYYAAIAGRLGWVGNT